MPARLWTGRFTEQQKCCETRSRDTDGRRNTFRRTDPKSAKVSGVDGFSKTRKPKGDMEVGKSTIGTKPVCRKMDRGKI
jgi:hypothetical protein